MGLILPKYYNLDEEMKGPGPWYVVESHCDHLGPEIAQNVRPMYRDQRREPCQLYMLSKVHELYNKGYVILGDDPDKNFLDPKDIINETIVTLKYHPSGFVPILGMKQYIIYGVYSRRMVEAGKFVKPDE